MQKRTNQRSPRLHTYILACVLGAVALPAHSQTNISAPSGWAKSASGGNVVFSQPESGSRFVVYRLTALGGTTRDWFETQVERDSRTRGQLISPGDVKLSSGTYLIGRNFRVGSKTQSVIYVGYAVGNQGRLLVYSAANPQILKRELPAFLETGQQVRVFDHSGKNRIAQSTPSTGRAPRGTGRKAAAAGIGGSVKVAPVRGAVNSKQFLGVYLNESWISGVGGMPLLSYEPVLLLRDGTARREPELPPAQHMTASDRAGYPRDWGRWTRNGDKIKVRWSDGDTDDIKVSFKTRPARPGQFLGGSYRTLSGGGNTALGGNITTFSSNEYTFARNGRFTTERSGGGMSSSVTASSTSKNAGSYRLDGHTLTLKFNDGRVVRRLFYFYPDDKNGRVVGIGDDAYVIDD